MQVRFLPVAHKIKERDAKAFRDFYFTARRSNIFVLRPAFGRQEQRQKLRAGVAKFFRQ
jgi:hypothetical protein